MSTGPASGSGSGPGPASGSGSGQLAEEARRLVEAAREWAVRAVPDAHRVPIATGAPECCWCPLCRAVAVLRGGHPEVTEKLAEVVTAAASALAAVLDAATRPAPPAGPPTGAPPADGAAVDHAPPRRRVEAIPLDED